MTRLAKMALTLVRYALSLGILWGVWAGAAAWLDLPAYLLPAPSAVFRTLAEEPEFYARATAATLTNMAVGSAVGITLGFLLGALAASSRPVRWLVEPYLTAFQSFPREAFFPLIVVWLGFGALPKMVNAALLCFFPMAMITLASLADTRSDYLALFRSWNSSRLDEFLYCRLPAAVPGLVGGLRVCLPLALIGAVLGEFLGGSVGLGYIIVSSGSNFRVDRIFGAIVVLAASGILIVGAIELMQRTFLRRFYQQPSEI